MTYQEKFEELKKKYGNVNAKKIKNGFAVQVNMTDEDCGGTFYIANMAGNFAFEPYDYRDNTASIDASSAVLSELFEGKQTVETAVSTGVLYVYGSDEDVEYMFDAMRKAKAEPKKKPFAKQAEPALKTETASEKKPAEPVKTEPKKAESKPAAKKPSSSKTKKSKKK